MFVIRKRYLLLALLVAASFWAHQQRLQWFSPEAWVTIVARHPVSAPIGFVAAYALAGTGFVPTLPLNLAAGFLWGPAVGSVLAIIASILAAFAGFAAARATLGRVFVARMQGNQLLERLQDAMRVHGWKVVAFVRLNPAFPGPVNYVFGMSSIDVRTYCWATAVFVIPPPVAFAVLGHSLGSLAYSGALGGLGTTLRLGGVSVLFLVLCALLLKRHFPGAAPRDAPGPTVASAAIAASPALAPQALDDP